MTLSAWIKPTAAQSRLAHDRAAGDRRLLPEREQRRRRRCGRRAAGRSAAHTEWLSGPTASPVNAWTHVALTYDGTTLRLYVNGVQVATKAATGAIQTTTNPLWIGGNSPYGEYFQG